MMINQSPPRDFDIGVARRLGELEKQIAYLKSIIINPGLSAGSWTPAYDGSTTPGVFTYVVQKGAYWVISDLVIITAELAISAIGTPPVGSMRISGLPFTSSATANQTGGVTLDLISNFNNAANVIQLTGVILTGSSRITLYESFDNAAAVVVPAANFTNVNCLIYLHGVYQKA